MFTTKVVIVLRDDLAPWQSLNVTAFLSTGLAGLVPDLLGEPYRDRNGNVYAALSRQPIIVLAAPAATLTQIQQRALEHEVPLAAYTEAMFSTGHDAANREVFAATGPDDAVLVGLALQAPKNVADKITKGSRLHP